MDKAKSVEIYCVVDEFCKGADRYMAPKTLVEDGKRKRHRKPMMSDSEVMTILIMFHLSRMRDLKSFYLGYIKGHCQQDFPKQLSYNRFVERQTSVGAYLMFFSTSAVLVLVRVFHSLTRHRYVLATSSVPINIAASRAGRKQVNLLWAGFMASSYI